MRLSDHSKVVALLAIFAYLIDMSKIDCGTVPCSLLKLHILQSPLELNITNRKYKFLRLVS